MYRSMTGLGILQTSATGVSSRPTPGCITAEERAEAQQKCQRVLLHGIGDSDLAPMSGRLAGFSACAMANLPVCPAPTCLDTYTAGLIANCMEGRPSTPDFDCSSLFAYGLSRLPFCPGALTLPPVPSCLPPATVQARDYCKAYPGMQGPDKSMNASCWVMSHYPAYMSQLAATPNCSTGHALAPPTVVHRPPAAPPVGPPLDTNAPPGDDSEASMSGTWGILALLAVAGGGYYMYRRYKK